MITPPRLESGRKSGFGATMRITAKAEYACLAVIELARSGRVGAPKRVRDLAGAQNIPQSYLIQILLQLKAAGLVHSSRGAVGGYQLARNPSEISVADVIAAIDGREERTRKAESAVGRDLSELLERASAAKWDVLAAATIARLAGTDTQPDWVL
jgi:Rrf2 family transcriptional regulator, cysteine metabolism repressor